MSLQRFRLITFDVRGTLLRSNPAKQFADIATVLNIKCDLNDLENHFKSNWHKMNRAHPNFGRYSTLGWQNWWHQIISNTFRESGGKMTDENMSKFANQIIDLYKTNTYWQHSNGAIEFLNYLKIQQQLGAKTTSNGKPEFLLGVIANFDPRLNIIMRNMQIDHFFDFILNSYECRCEKPSKEFFDYARKFADTEMENLKPEQCLHIGNTPVTDYFGAKNAGWLSALVHDKDLKYLNRKYNDKINGHQCFPNLFDLHKKMANNFISW